MERPSFQIELERVCDTLPPQLAKAARYMIGHPDQVALKSMRELARLAGVQPWTVTRLARRLGVADYETIRRAYGNSMRDAALGFSKRAGLQSRTMAEEGDVAFIGRFVGIASDQILAIAGKDTCARLVSAAARLARARRIHVIGLRACWPVASHFSYMLRFAGRETVLLDAAAGTGIDPLSEAGETDVLVACSVAPYARVTVEAVRFARGANVPIVAITDDAAGPLARMADDAILVGTDSPSFFHSIAPAFTAAELLATLVCGQCSEDATTAIRETERRLTGLQIHWNDDSEGART